MHTPAFCAVVLPLLVAALASLSLASMWFVPFENRWVGYVNMALSAQLALLFHRCWLVMMKRSAALTARVQLPESPSTSLFSKIVQPWSEEAMKLFLIFCTSAFVPSPLIRSYAWVVAVVFAANGLIFNLATFSPLFYRHRYSTFIGLYSKFEHHSTNSRFSFSSPKSTSHSAYSGSTLLSYSSEPKPEPVAMNSAASPGIKSSPGIMSDSEPDFTTKYPQRPSINPFQDPNPVFNLEFFSPAVPIPQNDAHRDSDCHYSVSPKDTVYIYAPPSPQIEPESELPQTPEGPQTPERYRPERNNESPIGYRSSSRDSSDADTLRTHFSGGGGGGLTWKYPGGKLQFGGGGGFGYDHSSSGSNSSLSNSSVYTSKKRNFRQWFAWLLPSFKKSPPVPPPVRRVAERKALTKKLSTFTLNSDTHSLKSSKSRPVSYGSVDLESQTEKTVLNFHRYYQFTAFANQYLDFWAGSTLGLISAIDPSFRRFGVPLPQLSTLHFFLYELSIILWTFSSTLVYVMPFTDTHGGISASGVVALLVFKLFCANYLHSQCTRSYKFAIAMEFLGNACIYGLVSLV